MESNFQSKHVLVIIASLTLFTVPLVTQNQAFAQMESMRITGYQYPEIDSTFTINVIAQGTARTSGSTFNLHGTIYEKENPKWVVYQFVHNAFSGTNTIKIDLKEHEMLKPYKVGTPYIIEIQHVDIITTFEFTPQEKNASVPQVGVISVPKTIADLEDENRILKQEIEKKDAVIREQIKVIQNLASMIKKVIFAYFEF